METYILVVVFVLAGVCLHLNIISKDKREFDTVVQVAVILIMAHAAIAFISELHHSTGFVYAAITLSWLVYAVWVVYLVSRKKDMIRAEFKNLLSSIVIILFSLAAFLTIMVYTQAIDGVKSLRVTTTLLIYLGMFGGVVLIYQYTFRRFKKNVTDTRDTAGSVLPKKEAESQTLEYQKSSLKEEGMVKYSERVTAFIESGGYLDADLSLGKIAVELKIPKHHLSQLFSQYYRQGFLEYINTLRIRHACNILNNQKANVNIADLVEQCGFKSKPSFYRNFKSIMGMTPTEFQSSSMSL